MPSELKNEIAEYLAFDDIANLGLAFRHCCSLFAPLYRMRLENLVSGYEKAQQDEEHTSDAVHIRIILECIRKEFSLILLYCAGLDRLFNTNSVSIWDESLFSRLPIGLFCAWHDARYHGYWAYSDLKCNASVTECKCGRCYAAIGLVVLGELKQEKALLGFPVLKHDGSGDFRYIETVYQSVLEASSLDYYKRNFGTGEYVLINVPQTVESISFLKGSRVTLFSSVVPHMSDDTDEYLNTLI